MSDESNQNAPGRKINLLYVLDHDSPVDLQWQRQISKHLYLSRAQGILVERAPFSIPEDEVCRYAAEAEIALFLVSPDLLSLEDARLLNKCFELYEKEQSPRVVPVILRECSWKMSKYGSLVNVPRDRGPVAKWADPDSALANVANEVRGLVESLRKAPRAVPFREGHGIWK